MIGFSLFSINVLAYFCYTIASTMYKTPLSLFLPRVLENIPLYFLSSRDLYGPVGGLPRVHVRIR